MKEKKIGRMLVFYPLVILVTIMLLLTATVMPVVNAAPYVDRQRNTNYMGSLYNMCGSAVKNSTKAQRLTQWFINTIPASKLNQAYNETTRMINHFLDDPPGITNLRDMVLMVYEIVVIFFGHNAFSAVVTWLLTIWIVYPLVIAMSAQVSHNSFWEAWNQFMQDETLSSWLYNFGLIGLFIYPFVLAFSFCVVFIEWLGSISVNFGHDIQNFLAEIYSGLGVKKKVF